MLEALVAMAAGVCIFLRGVHVLRRMDRRSNHFFRVSWSVAVGGSLGLICAPLAGYQVGAIELSVIVAFAAIVAFDKRDAPAADQFSGGNRSHVQ